MFHRLLCSLEFIRADVFMPKLLQLCVLQKGEK